MKADVILFVGSAAGNSDSTAIERNALSWSPLAQKSLILLHNEGEPRLAAKTSHWLDVSKAADFENIRGSWLTYLPG